ncbi:uncharacterized protein LOC131941502 isoform X2 [Physella acuta]|uniref:uncharacterized protein LOC131941502 isoform X2 n=1 Tax=Physella acuta TaxID=109671 RepID=UPI0027DC17AA|nr:uncharacterized protein LOC131941502 isoform X2 [Physella acuta]
MSSAVYYRPTNLFRCIQSMYYFKYLVLNTVFIFPMYTLSEYIKLSPHNQRDSITSCTKGLREQKDKAVFTSEVKFDSNTTDYTRIISYEIKRHSEASFSLLCTVSINQGCQGFEDRDCYCNHTDAQDVHHIFINRTVLQMDSEAEIRGYLYHISSNKLYSSVQTLPTVYSSTSRLLQINGKSYIGPNCYVEMNANEDQVVFSCLNTPSPCFTKIYQKGTVVASGSMSTSYTASSGDNRVTEFIFRSSVCDEDYEQTLSSCIFVREKNMDWQSGILIVSFLLLIVQTVGMFPYLIIRHRQLQKKVSDHIQFTEQQFSLNENASI